MTPPRESSNAGRPKKHDVRAIACPRCSAGPGSSCLNERSGAKRHRNHIERVARYRDGMYGPVESVEVVERSFCEAFIETPGSAWTGTSCKLLSGHDGPCSPHYRSEANG